MRSSRRWGPIAPQARPQQLMQPSSRRSLLISSLTSSQRRSPCVSVAGLPPAPGLRQPSGAPWARPQVLTARARTAQPMPCLRLLMRHTHRRSAGAGFRGQEPGQQASKQQTTMRPEMGSCMSRSPIPNQNLLPIQAGGARLPPSRYSRTALRLVGSCCMGTLQSCH